jgi:hypothetical protein
VVRKHRILFAIPVNEGAPDPHFACLPSIDLARTITFLQRSQPLADDAEGEDKELDAILEDQHNTDFKAEYGTLPFWRLIILQSPGGKAFTASFIYHHAIGDGVSGLAFHNVFRNALDAASAFSLPDKTETIILPDEKSVLPPLEELHPLPINPSQPHPPMTNVREWTGNSIQIPCKSHWASFYLSPSASKAFVQECKERKLSVTSALSSIVATALFGYLPPTVEALTCIIPVSLRPWLKLPREIADNGIGTYFDATRVQFTRTDQTDQTSQNSSVVDVWSRAQHVSKSINDYLGNLSPSGEPHTSVAVLKTIPDVSIVFNSMLGKPRDAAFEVTNVGLFSPAPTPQTTEDAHWQVWNVLLSRSTAVPGAAVTVSVVTGGNGIMALGFSWQEGVVEDGFIDNVRQAVRKYFEKYQF